jgi:hypothetical protein
MVNSTRLKISRELVKTILDESVKVSLEEISTGVSRLNKENCSHGYDGGAIQSTKASNGTQSG